MPNADLLQTVVSLANLGFIGVGVIVFLLVFLLLIRDKPVVAANAKLRSRFLTWGVSFAIISGVLGILAPWLLPAQPSGPSNVTLTFSPSFDVVKLPPPQIRLPDGSVAEPSKPFQVTSNTQIVVSVDAALEQVKQLNQTAAVMTANASEYRKQRDVLLAALPETREITALRSTVATALPQIAETELAVKDSLASGNFAKASAASAQLAARVANSTNLIQDGVRKPSR